MHNKTKRAIFDKLCKVRLAWSRISNHVSSFQFWISIFSRFFNLEFSSLLSSFSFLIRVYIYIYSKLRTIYARSISILHPGSKLTIVKVCKRVGNLHKGWNLRNLAWFASSSYVRKFRKPSRGLLSLSLSLSRFSPLPGQFDIEIWSNPLSSSLFFPHSITLCFLEPSQIEFFQLEWHVAEFTRLQPPLRLACTGWRVSNELRSILW